MKAAIAKSWSVSGHSKKTECGMLYVSQTVNSIINREWERSACFAQSHVPGCDSSKHLSNRPSAVKVGHSSNANWAASNVIPVQAAISAGGNDSSSKGAVEETSAKTIRENTRSGTVISP